MSASTSSDLAPPAVMDDRENRPRTPAARLLALLGWNTTSYVLISIFAAVVLLIIIVWWPLAEDYLATADPRYPLWLQMDWLLLGVFAAMSLLIMARPDLKADARIVLIGLAGGLVIESWGTQTHLWTYYTNERPPLWIIPAWPIASLTIDRLYRMLRRVTGSQGQALPEPALPIGGLRLSGAKGFGRAPDRQARQAKPGRSSATTGGAWAGVYWVVFISFVVMMLAFVWPTLDKSLTLAALALVALLIATPTDYRGAVLTFVAGTGLGYFLELWGTTRACWTYYTLETPPMFAVYAHGMAAVAFWRVGLLWETVARRLALAHPPKPSKRSSDRAPRTTPETS